MNRQVFLYIAILIISYFVWYPLFRMQYNELLPLFGYKPWIVHARDNVYLIVGYTGSMMAVKNVRYAWHLLNFFSVGWITTFVVDYVFGNMYFDDFHMYILLAILIITLTNLKNFQQKVQLDKPNKPYLIMGMYAVLSTIVDIGICLS